MNWQNSESGDVECDEYDSSQEMEFLDNETNHVEEKPDNVVQSELPSNIEGKDEGETDTKGIYIKWNQKHRANTNNVCQYYTFLVLGFQSIPVLISQIQLNMLIMNTAVVNL